ncbi:MAG: translation initiation factor IF-6 [Candidatus Micrarchaeia archaeon]
MTEKHNKTTYYGNSWIGLFVKSNKSHTIIPVDAMDKITDAAKQSLGTEMVKMLIGGSNLVGLYIAMNSNGAIVPNVTSEEEMQQLKELGINVYRSREHHNAHGNNIALNDKGGIINPSIGWEERKRIADVLGIELVEASIAKYQTVGSCAIATNNGFLAHFGASDDEMKLLESVFKVRGSKGSVNMGTGFVSLGVSANEKGYLVGEQTSAFEMGRIEEALGLIK